MTALGLCFLKKGSFTWEQKDRQIKKLVEICLWAGFTLISLEKKTLQMREYFFQRGKRYMDAVKIFLEKDYSKKPGNSANADHTWL